MADSLLPFARLPHAALKFRWRWVLVDQVFGFWEEILPLTDVVPTATLAWTAVALGARRRFFNTPRRRHFAALSFLAAS